MSACRRRVQSPWKNRRPFVGHSYSSPQSLLHFRFSSLSNLVAHQGDFVVAQSLLTEPVRARDLLERMNSGLNTFGPGDSNQLDIPVDVANSKDALPAGFKIGIDGDASIVIEADSQSFKRFLRREKSDLNDCGNAIDF